MPTITVDLDDLRGLIGHGALSEEEIEGHLALVKGEIDGRAPEEGEAAVRIELQDTNRPDLWCPEGIARQIRAKLTGKIDRDYGSAFEAAPGEGLFIDADASLEKLRPVVGGFVVQGVTIDDAGLTGFVQTQEKLVDNYGRRRENVAIGIYDASRIAFPIRYAGVPRDGDVTFTPLGFEEAMTPGRVLEEHPKGKEHAHILDKGGKKADTVPMLIDAKGVVLSFPPVINSRELGEVKPGDDHLFVEATGHDAYAVTLALNILAANMVDRGGTIRRVTTRYPYDTGLGRETVAPQAFGRGQSATTTVRDVARFTGLDVDEAEVTTRLLEYGVTTEAKDGQVVATIPAWRADYLHSVDVVEDYAIARGFDAFEPILPEDWSPGKLAPETELEDHLRDRMIGFGFEEIISNLLSSRDRERVRMGLGAADAGSDAEDEGAQTPPGSPPPPGGQLVRIVNPMSETFSALRDWLIPSLLRVEAASAKALYPHRVFEAGEVAVADEKQNEGCRTEHRLAGLIAHASASFTDAHGALHLLMDDLGLGESYELVATADHPTFIPSRMGLVRAGKGDAARVVGFIGEVHPQVLDAWGIRAPVAVFEVVQDILGPIVRG